MALPASWTEETLVASMEREIEAVSAALELDAMGLIATTVQEDVPSVLGVDSVAAVAYAGVADVIKVRTIAQWLAWQRAYEVAAPEFRIKAGSVDVAQSEAFDHLEKILACKAAAALRYPEAAAVLTSDGRRAVVPATGRLRTTAPVTPCWPPDANDPAYSGSPYSRLRGG